MTTAPSVEAAPIQMEDVASVVVDLEGDDALVDVVRPPREARQVIENLQEKYPDRPLMAFFGLDIMSSEFDDETHIIRGEN